MLKKTVFLIAIILLLIPGFKTDAAEKEVIDKDDVLESSDDYESALNLTSTIQKEVLGLLKIQEIEIAEETVLIDYANAVKVYNDCNIFKAEEYNKNTIMEIATEGHYAWELPACSNGFRFRIVLSKGLPLSENGRKNLSEEEQKEVIENEGKLKVSAVELLQEGTKYLYEWIDEKDYSNFTIPNVKIFGSQPGFIYPIAVLFDGTEAVGCFSVGYNTEYKFEGAIDAFKDITNWVKTKGSVFSDELIGGNTSKSTDMTKEVNNSENEKDIIAPLGIVLISVISMGLLVTLILKKRNVR